MANTPKKEVEPLEPEVVEVVADDEVDEDGAGDGVVIEAEVVESASTPAVEIDGDDEVPVLEEEEEDRASLVPLDPLQRYLAESRRYPLLSREEEKELAIRYVEEEDVDAAYRLVTANLRLVVMVAREYAKASRNVLDLVQEGNIGLMEAVKRFDPYRGVRFPSYAVYWVRAYIIRYLINNWRIVKLGTTQAQRKLFFNLQKEKKKLEQMGVFPEAKLIAQRLDVKEKEVIEMDQRLSSRDLSVDAPTRDDDSGSLLDVLPSPSADTEGDVADAQFQARIGAALAEFGETLEGREAHIFEARLIATEPMTLQDLGNEYGVSRERMRQIESRIKKKLKKFLLERFEDIEDAV